MDNIQNKIIYKKTADYDNISSTTNSINSQLDLDDSIISTDNNSYIYNDDTIYTNNNNLMYNINKELTKNYSKKRFVYVTTPPEAWAQLAKLLNLKKGNLKNTNKKNLSSLNQKFDAKSKISFRIEDFRIEDSRLNHRFGTSNYKKNNKTKETLELGRKWFFKKFMNPRTYDLSKQGRISINKKLSLNVSVHQTTLTAQDLLAATDYLMKVEKGLYEIDDIDHLKNRRVRSSGELIQVQFGIGLMRLEKAIRFKLNNDKNFLRNLMPIVKGPFFDGNMSRFENSISFKNKKIENSVLNLNHSILNVPYIKNMKQKDLNFKFF